MYMENRFKMLTKINSETAKELLKEAQFDVNTRWQMYQYLASKKLQERLGTLSSGIVAMGV